MSDIKSILEKLASFIVKDFKEQDNDSKVSDEPDEDVINNFLETELNELNDQSPMDFLVETCSSLYGDDQEDENDDPDNDDEFDPDAEDDEFDPDAEEAEAEENKAAA
jgi:hypothetical protein